MTCLTQREHLVRNECESVAVESELYVEIVLLTTYQNDVRYL